MWYLYILRFINLVIGTHSTPPNSEYGHSHIQYEVIVIKSADIMHAHIALINI